MQPVHPGALAIKFYSDGQVDLVDTVAFNWQGNLTGFSLTDKNQLSGPHYSTDVAFLIISFIYVLL